MTIINHKGQLFHYRGREEFNDNNAAAFKFTPTDEIWPLNEALPQQSYPSTHPCTMADHKSDYPAHAVTYPPQSVHDLKDDLQLHIPATHTVFNEHIKPDLINSRLRLGPSVFRSAVDTGFTSPSKGSGFHGPGLEGLLLGQQSSRQDLHHNSSTTLGSSDTMNPSASTFTPSGDLALTPFEPSDPVNLSLARALAEKTDEVYTLKAALEAENRRRVHAEKELSKVSMLNKSLASSVQMLGSIVKHNAEKPSTETKFHNAGVQEDTHRAISSTPGAQESGASESILYDTLKAQRQQYEETGYPASNDKPKCPTEPNSKVLKTTGQFDVGLLQPRCPTDQSHVATLSRTLRKHFFSSEESIKGINRAAAAKTIPATADEHLIDFSPRSDLSNDSPGRTVRNQIVGTLESCRWAIDKTKTLMYPSRPSVVDHFSDEWKPASTHNQTSKEVKPKQVTSPSPMLFLPASILEKYGRPPSSTAHTEIDPETREERVVRFGTTFGSPSSSKGKFQSSKKSADTTDFGDTTPQSGGCPLPHNVTPSKACAEQSNIGSNFGTPTRPKHINVVSFPYTTTIYWNVHANNPIFDDDDDLQMTRRQILAPSAIFWDHPVRYLPQLSERNLYRTMMIDFIPQGSTYRDILGYIHGGTVESIQLFPPIGTSTKFMTARVVFVAEASAHGLYLRNQKHPIRIRGQQVRVWQILQPTYPRNPKLTKAISEGATRMLGIINISERAEHLLRTKLMPQKAAGFLIQEMETFDACPLFEFTTIAEAVKAANIVETDRDLGGTMAVFENDPCEGYIYAPEEAL